MAMMCSGRKTFAGTPSYSIGRVLRTASSVRPVAARNWEGKTVNEQMLALDAPATLLEVSVDRWDAGRESFLGRDKHNVCVVGGERLDVVDRGERAAERVFFDQAGSYEVIRGAKNFPQRNG
jgi:hypothetical protein